MMELTLECKDPRPNSSPGTGILELSVTQFRSNHFIELDQLQRSFSFPPAHFSQMSSKAAGMKAPNLLHCKLGLVQINLICNLN